MANVNQINETIQPQTGQVKNKSRATQSSDAFDALLNTALNKQEDASGTAGVSGLEELEAPRFDPETPSLVVTGKTDELLGLLDTYASQLGDPQVSLKSISPILEQMTADADVLMKETRLLGNQDDELKEIATRTAVAAQTEYVKFQRGDYLS